jgi:hypothetical protein
MRHARPIGIPQQLVAHVQRGFKGSHPREWLHGIGRKRAGYVVDRIEALKAFPSKIGIEHFR